MVIEPNTKVFNKMIDMLSSIKKFDAKKIPDNDTDIFQQGGYSDQE